MFFFSKDDNARTVNHYGGEREARSDIKETEAHNNIIQVSPLDLISRHEKVEFEARKKFYEDLVYSRKKIPRLKTVAKGKNFLTRIWYQVANLILWVLTGHITCHLRHSTLEL